MFINKIIDKININNVDEYIDYTLNNQYIAKGLKKAIIDKIDKKIKHTLINQGL